MEVQGFDIIHSHCPISSTLVARELRVVAGGDKDKITAGDWYEAGTSQGGSEMEKTNNSAAPITLYLLNGQFSVCKVSDYSKVDLTRPFCFIEKTDEENSLVCETEAVPDNTTEREDGWKAFRIMGTLDFSLVGILAKISALLAKAEIGIFAISTYNTDYILTKEADYDRTLQILTENGYKTGGSS